MLLKIVSDGTPWGTKVVDAATGETVENVQAISWDVDAARGLSRMEMRAVNIPVEIVADDGRTLSGEAEIGISAEIGQTQTRIVKKEKPELILLDVKMKGMDGIAATALLVAMLPECSVIILTIGGGSATRARAMAAGAKAFVEKGWPGEIEEAVRQFSGVSARETVRRAGGDPISSSNNATSAS